jgi:hypothetical protein
VKTESGREAYSALSQIDGCCANAIMRGLPCPLQRGHCTMAPSGLAIAEGLERRLGENSAGACCKFAVMVATGKQVAVNVKRHHN